MGIAEGLLGVSESLGQIAETQSSQALQLYAARADQRERDRMYDWRKFENSQAQGRWDKSFGLQKEEFAFKQAKEAKPNWTMKTQLVPQYGYVWGEAGAPPVGEDPAGYPREWKQTGSVTELILFNANSENPTDTFKRWDGKTWSDYSGSGVNYVKSREDVYELVREHFLRTQGVSLTNEQIDAGDYIRKLEEITGQSFSTQSSVPGSKGKVDGVGAELVTSAEQPQVLIPEGQTIAELKGKEQAVIADPDAEEDWEPWYEHQYIGAEKIVAGAKTVAEWSDKTGLPWTINSLSKIIGLPFDSTAFIINQLMPEGKTIGDPVLGSKWLAENFFGGPDKLIEAIKKYKEEHLEELRQQAEVTTDEQVTTFSESDIPEAPVYDPLSVQGGIIKDAPTGGVGDFADVHLSALSIKELQALKQKVTESLGTIDGRDKNAGRTASLIKQRISEIDEEITSRPADTSVEPQGDYYGGEFPADRFQGMEFEVSIDDIISGAKSDLASQLPAGAAEQAIALLNQGVSDYDAGATQRPATFDEGHPLISDMSEYVAAKDAPVSTETADTWPSITKGQPLTDAEILISASEGGTVWGQKIREIAGKHGIDPKDLLSIMRFETGGSFSASVANPESGATGLIQFTAPVAKELGTTLAELAQMSREEQLVYVDRYLDMRKKPPFNLPERGASLDDLYMAVLHPAAIGEDSSYVLFRSGTGSEVEQKRYDQNKGLDSNNDGTITKGEAVAKVRSYKSKQEPTAITAETNARGDPRQYEFPPPDEPAPINAELPLVDKMSEYVAAKDATEPASVVTGKEPTSEKAVLEILDRPSLAPGVNYDPTKDWVMPGDEIPSGNFMGINEDIVLTKIAGAKAVVDQMEAEGTTTEEWIRTQRKLKSAEWQTNTENELRNKLILNDVPEGRGVGMRKSLTAVVNAYRELELRKARGDDVEKSIMALSITALPNIYIHTAPEGMSQEEFLNIVEKAFERMPNLWSVFGKGKTGFRVGVLALRGAQALELHKSDTIGGHFTDLGLKGDRISPSDKDKQALANQYGIIYNEAVSDFPANRGLGTGTNFGNQRGNNNAGIIKQHIPKFRNK